MPTDKKSYTYEPKPNTRRPAMETAHDMTKRMPSSGSRNGKIGYVKSVKKDGVMNGGGKRRSKGM